MPYEVLYCLMVQRVSLNGRMRSSLLTAAAEMLRRQGERGAGRRRVKDDDIEGVVSTEFQFACLGSIAGIEFSAEVETDLGQGRVTFLVDPRLGFLEDEGIMGGRWTDVTDRFRRAEAAPNN